MAKKREPILKACINGKWVDIDLAVRGELSELKVQYSTYEYLGVATAVDLEGVDMTSKKGIDHCFKRRT